MPAAMAGPPGASSFAFLFPDFTPPSPDPLTWELPPHAVSTTAIAMRATLAADADSPPVQYIFEFVTGGAGGLTTPWQASRDYTNSGLAVNTLYTYRATARDCAPSPNQTSPTDTLGAYTFAEVPGAPALNGATTNTLNVNVDPSTNPAPTEFAIQCALYYRCKLERQIRRRHRQPERGGDLADGHRLGHAYAARPGTEHAVLLPGQGPQRRPD